MEASVSSETVDGITSHKTYFVYLAAERTPHPVDKLCKGGFTHTMPFPCHFPAVPLPYRSTKALDCVFPILFTQCGRVWFTHAMPFPCHATNMPFWKRPLKAMAGSWHVRGRIAAAGWRHVGDLPLLVPGSLLSDAYQSQMQWPVWNRALSENGRVAAGEQHGKAMVCVNLSLKPQGNSMVCVNPP
jgi:hypothetical protein